MPSTTTANSGPSNFGPLSLEQARLLRPTEVDPTVEGRVRFLAENLELRLPLHSLTVVNFACGIGNDSRELREQLRAEKVIGLDTDHAALKVAEQRYYDSRFFSWTSQATEIAMESVDVVYGVGIFQARSVEERSELLRSFHGWLKPGGYLALFENNPICLWGSSVLPKTQWKREGRRVRQSEVSKLIRTAGFEFPLIRSLLFFPKLLSFLRPCEPLLSVLPFGAQFMALSKRSE